jgi:hypothetical protein
MPNPIGTMAIRTLRTVSDVTNRVTRQRSRGAGLSLAALAFVAMGLPSHRAQAQGSKPVVHVFLPLDAKLSVVEKTLQGKLSGLEITVFSRFRDFDATSNIRKPDALLSILPVLESRGAKPVLQGMRAGKATEAYVLASVGQALSGSLSGKTIGAVDLLNRDGTQRFISGLLKTDIKIKPVAKVEDLLPLLEFSAADGIVLPSSMLAKLMERTRLPVKTHDLPGAQVGLLAVAVPNSAVRDTVVNAFQKLDRATKSMLGIDDWSLR